VLHCVASSLSTADPAENVTPFCSPALQLHYAVPLTNPVALLFITKAPNLIK
jgi:hypothetical protein